MHILHMAANDSTLSISHRRGIMPTLNNPYFQEMAAVSEF